MSFDPAVLESYPISRGHLTEMFLVKHLGPVGAENPTQQHERRAFAVCGGIALFRKDLSKSSP